LLEDRDVHACDHRGRIRRSELPLQAAEIVIHLRAPYRAKHEPRMFLKDAPGRRVNSVATCGLSLIVEEGASLGVDLSDHDLAAHGISLSEYLE